MSRAPDRHVPDAAPQPEIPVESDLDALARIVSLAFAGTRDTSRAWLAPLLSELRVVRAGGEIAATMMRIPMGMNLMGSSVPIIGVAGVGVAPEFRGSGHARTLMAGCLREMHRAGVAFSTLHASTHTLYSRVGYASAGHRFEHKISLRLIDVRERELTIRPVTGPEDPGVRACYARYAHASHGSLDRGPYIWGRVGLWKGNVYQGFAAMNDRGETEGYVFLTQATRPDMRHDIVVSDVAFTTPRAGRRILAFLAEFRSMGADLVLSHGPVHPLLQLLSERHYTIELRDYWMARITNVEAALGARRYHPSTSGEVHLEIEDPVIPENAGRWTLSIDRGRPLVARGGRGELALDISALAPLYTGFQSTSQLALLGRIHGPADALDAASGLFAAPTPSTGDFY